MTEQSPLAEIERLALDEANQSKLDIGADVAETQLRAIVMNLVEQWRSDYRRGLRGLVRRRLLGIDVPEFDLAHPHDVAVVENEESVLIGMRELLEGWGCEVFTATCGRNARHLISQLGRAPHLEGQPHRRHPGIRQRRLSPG